MQKQIGLDAHHVTSCLQWTTVCGAGQPVGGMALINYWVDKLLLECLFNYLDYEIGLKIIDGQ